jgi:SAM-dependent methyltransferase
MKTIASVEFNLKWNSDGVQHQDGYYAPKVNFWRDILPPGMELNSHAPQAQGEFMPGDLLPMYDNRQIVSLKSVQFDRHFVKHMTIEPRLGRFYPAGVLHGVDGIYKSTRMPAQCIAMQDDSLRFDLNHPLADEDIVFSAELRSEPVELGAERGGVCFDWAEASAANGPGMQARDADISPDYWADEPFKRQDESKDEGFYAHPRMIHHIDDAARTEITRLYGRLLKPGMKVLDLMSSWASHLPDNLDLPHVAGLGMNQAELDANPRLQERVVHDLNQQPALPFANESFDAVICTASVEYLIQPFDVFADVARVLKPGGLFIHTFSNRWFPPKAIKVWGELHEFERLRMVLEYFLRSGRYGSLNTFSLRNLPRPEDDKYYGQIPHADPVYAVWGQRL